MLGTEDILPDLAIVLHRTSCPGDKLIVVLGLCFRCGQLLVRGVVAKSKSLSHGHCGVYR